MTEISSDGVSLCLHICPIILFANQKKNVNTVDVIFPTWPILLYTNPAFGSYLLEGLFRYQATGQYPNKWSVHDLGAPLHRTWDIFLTVHAGSHYPKALGHNDGKDEQMPVEGM